MNKDQIPRVRLCWTQESAADRLAKDLEERSQLKARLPLPRPFSLSELSVSNGNAAFRAESMGFDLAADFLYSIVIPIDLMTFQTRDIRMLRGSWLVLRLVAPSILFAFIGLYRYRRVTFLLRRLPCNSLKSIRLGV